MSTLTIRIKQCWKYLIHGVLPEQKQMDVYTLLSMAYLGQALFVATKVGVIDQLANGPKSLNDLAQLTDVDNAYLRQIMRALAGWDLLAYDKLGLYRLTPISEVLVDKTGWLRQHLTYWGEGYYTCAGLMYNILKSNKTKSDKSYTETIFSNLYSNPSAAKTFIDYMSFITDLQSSAIVSSFDFTPYHHVVDVGGGRASLISAVLRANPHLLGTIIDLPCMKTNVAERIDSEQLADRCTFVGGNFLESVPAGGDVYLIKHAIHDWPDKEVKKILNAISEAMHENSLLIIIEAVMNDKNGTDGLLKLASLERMFMTGGMNRTQHEFELLLLGANLRFKELRHTTLGDCSLVIACKQYGYV